MALTATFLADFSAFDEATKNSIALMQGFQNTALELGPATDRGMADAQKAFEAAGQSARRVANDALAVGKNFVAAYAETEAAASKLDTALKASGNATAAVKQQYDEMATAMQNTTRFSDDAITELQAKLTTIGKVGPENMQAAVTATANLATVMKIDLAAAGNLVAKAFESDGESLGKLKTILGDAYQPGMSAAEMLNKINEVTGTAAADDVNTYAGSMARLENQMGEIDETVGKGIVDKMSGLLGVFQQLPEPVQMVALAAGKLGIELAPLITSFSSFAIALANPAILAGLKAIGVTLGGLVTWPVLVVAALAAIAYAVYKYWDEITAATKALYDGLKYYLVAGFEAIAAAVKYPIKLIADAFTWLKNIVVGHSIVPDMLDGIGQEFARLDYEMVTPAQAACLGASRAFQDLGLQIDNYAETYRSYLAAFGGGGASGLGMMGPLRAPDLFQYAREQGRVSAIGGGATGPVTVNMSGMLSANDPQTKALIKDLVGEAIMEALRGQRLFSSA